MRWATSLLICILFASNLASAAHYIIGQVSDARDGTLANNHVIMLWKNSMADNLTDKIGPSGNSGANNIYMFDCEMLKTPCSINDILHLKVLNTGDNYSTEIFTVKVTGNAYDIANSILNSPPKAFLVSPEDKANRTSTVQFNCTSSDLDGNIANITLYGNWTGTWQAIETLPTNSSAVFTKTLSEGKYKWTCLATDNLSVSSFSSSNFTLTVDTTPPSISAIYINESYSCGTQSVKVNCSVSDSLSGIDTVLIASINPNETEKNYSTNYASNYYADILLSNSGDWHFRCIANDTVGNSANVISQAYSDITALPDLSIDKADIIFSDNNPIENENIQINATIRNNACGNANNFVVGFFNNSLNSQFSNLTVSLAGLSNLTITSNWTMGIGSTSFIVSVDANNSITEENESNNIANASIKVTSWQPIYGNVSFEMFVSSSQLVNMRSWQETNVRGNIFITSIESNINWQSLQAFGRNRTGNPSLTNDFADLDSLLGTSNFEDSVYNVYTNSGSPKSLDNFTVYNTIINNVPVVNSTNNSNFETGILWDTSKDSDGEFSQGDAENVIFVTKINPKKQGAYGVYDYEISIPAPLRHYNSANSNVYLYYSIS